MIGTDLALLPDPAPLLARRETCVWWFDHNFKAKITTR